MLKLGGGGGSILKVLSLMQHGAFHSNETERDKGAGGPQTIKLKNSLTGHIATVRRVVRWADQERGRKESDP